MEDIDNINDHKDGQAIYGCMNPYHKTCNHGGTADEDSKPWVYL